MSLERRDFLKLAAGGVLVCAVGAVPSASASLDDDNPFLTEWTEPFGAPPFARIRPQHFRPAFDRALAEHEREVDTIAGAIVTPTFENTIDVLELSGKPLLRVQNVFNTLAGAHTNEALRAIAREIAPRRSRHWSRFYLNEALFQRIDFLHQRRSALNLTTEQLRVLDLYHEDFLRSGAGLDAAKKQRLADINARLATLTTRFGQNVLVDEQAFVLVLETAEDLAGLPDFVRTTAAAAAAQRGQPGKHVITISSSGQFLQFSSRRDLREKVFKAVTTRGDRGGENDNKAVIAEILNLRGELARLLGYPDFAHYRLDGLMAKTPANARALLERVWTVACQSALVDRNDLQSLVRADAGDFTLAPWDRSYYAEKLGKQRHNIDAAAIRPYLQLDRMVEAAFYTANRLFGLTFEARSDVQVWHPDVRVWEVRRSDGRHLGLFFADHFARPNKNSGAWMGSLRLQQRLADDITPIVYNVTNFNKAPDGEQTLLSLGQARVLFHEFGHALHGLLSNVTYSRVSGTKVFTDFLEFPAQVMEHWVARPEILRRFAVHHRTGEVMPDALIEGMRGAQTFDMGARTVGYAASALIDLDLHSLLSAEEIDVAKVEQEMLERIGMPEEIAMFHRPPHFKHVFAGGYASAYYSYLWGEVLDSDGFAAFEEAGDVFSPEIARRLYEHVFSKGGSLDPAEAFRRFRGRPATADAMLRRRGFQS